MVPWKLIGSVPIPDTTYTLSLHQRGKEFSLRVDGHELMNNRRFGSEQALAELALAQLGSTERAKVLVGGLGMGFTLAAALERIGKQGSVVVAELMPAVLEWNQGPLSELAGHPLRDPRARVELDDVARVLRAASNAYDAILLDVDNGPSGLTVDRNDHLYSPAGLVQSRKALRPGGVLGIWSASQAPGFTQRLRRAGFDAKEHMARARGSEGGGARHTLWIAKRD